MAERENGIGYYAEGGNFYCVGCMNENTDMLRNSEKTIPAYYLSRDKYFCDGCQKEINQSI